MSDKKIVKCHECLRDINLLDEDVERIDTSIGLSWFFCGCDKEEDNLGE